MRAHRPGRMGSDEFDEEYQRQRQEKIDAYASRARDGLPLFDLVASSASAGKAVVTSAHS